MFEKYFAEFDVSEQELKEIIFSTLVGLNSIDPEEWPFVLLEELIPDKPLQEFLQSLRRLLPKLPTDLLIQCGYESSEVLRIIAIKIWMLLEGKQLNYRLTKMLFMACCDSFLSMRYLLAAEILTQKHNKELLSDPDVIFPILQKEYFDPDKSLRVLAAKKIAQREIDRLFEDESAVVIAGGSVTDRKQS